MTFQKLYATSGVYTVTLSVDWVGHTIDRVVSGHATQTDTINAVAQCNPVIITQPQPTNQYVLAGTTAQISVTATSVFPMSFQWYFNLTNPIVSPSAFDTLLLENVRPEATGLYSVLIANAYGSVTSSVAALNVILPLVTGITWNPDGGATLSFEGLPNSTSRRLIGSRSSRIVSEGVALGNSPTLKRQITRRGFIGSQRREILSACVSDFTYTVQLD
jgi:hypothetical protein